MICIVTAYSANCPIQHTGSYTATGKYIGKYRPGCSVDPKVIPLGSRISFDNGKAWYEADDTGVRGRHIDLRLASRGNCLRFGRRRINVLVKGKQRCIKPSGQSTYRSYQNRQKADSSPWLVRSMTTTIRAQEFQLTRATLTAINVGAYQVLNSWKNIRTSTIRKQ